MCGIHGMCFTRALAAPRCIKKKGAQWPRAVGSGSPRPDECGDLRGQALLAFFCSVTDLYMRYAPARMIAAGHHLSTHCSDTPNRV